MDAAATLVKDILDGLRGLESRRSPGLAKQVLDVFLLDTTSRLAALREGIARRDAKATYEAAHSMQGSASMVGAASLSERCSELAQAACADAFDRCEALAAEINTAFDALRHAAGQQGS